MGSSFSDSHAVKLAETKLSASQVLVWVSSLFLLSLLLLLVLLSTDPVLDGGRVLCLADGAAAAARRERAGDIV